MAAQLLCMRTMTRLTNRIFAWHIRASIDVYIFCCFTVFNVLCSVHLCLTKHETLSLRRGSFTAQSVIKYHACYPNLPVHGR